ncbi:hypothetical protein GN330_20635 [Nitratireductor sp. CAU 1489]|uniref:Uncharacterized protein n=1 Tax=Nitratireductor arenosus TaxID=2682096 RepID=A0A844QNW9_9HYPH|nr:hypothetical protein [Nitratireductor arenosus]MVA99663.1 hypothetical protein [Nitratireductor arenosus]
MSVRDNLAPHFEQSLRQRRVRSRAGIVRRVAMFQLKLFADGLRDVVMSPLSILAAIAGAFSKRDPELYFDRLMHFGRDTDRWINLFELSDPALRDTTTLDTIADDLEQAVRGDYASGGLSAQGAERLRRLAAQLRRRGDAGSDG